jgi:enoyl-CoA hydratase/carnithine racemase
MVRSRTGDVDIDIDGRVARAVLDRPGSKNALHPDVLIGLRAAVAAATRAGCSVFVLSGAGGTLSAGADLNYLHSILGDERELTAYIASIGSVLDLLAAARFISIAVVSDYALAGGCEMLLACDLSVVGDEARIGDRHLEYGLLPGAGGSVRLPAAMSGPLARRLLYTGEMIDGATAARWGLVSHAVPAAELEGAVEALVARLARHSPSALTAMKQLYRTTQTTPAAEALTAERAVLIGHLLNSAAAAEGLAAFGEGRKPDFAAEAPVGSAGTDERSTPR